MDACGARQASAAPLVVPSDCPPSDFLALQALGVPLVVSFGAGVDSTAMLIGFWAKGIRPDAILFSDTNAELPETYWHIWQFSGWLEEHGMPPVTIVRYRPTFAKYHSIEEKAFLHEELPGLAYGHKSCSIKFKGE